MNTDITTIPEEKRRRGRPKGSPNRCAKTVKEMILGALDELGGQTWLVEKAKAEPKAFMTLLSRLLPLQMTTNSPEGKSEPLKIVIDLPEKHE